MAEMKDVFAKAESKMNKSIDHLMEEYAAIRAGRANPAVLDHIMVNYYDTPTPINQLAAVSVTEARVLTIQPWDMSVLRGIEKAIQTSDLGVNPQNDGKVIRLVFPPLNEERRKELTKDVSKLGEEAKVAIRAIRRDAIEKLKEMKKAGDITEDDLKQAEKKTQDLTDKYVKNAEDCAQQKGEGDHGYLSRKGGRGLGIQPKHRMGNSTQLPVHIGIIMDGNGRWAKKRFLPRSAGHRAGASNFRTITRYCSRIGIQYLTIYAFSTENWSRPAEEVGGLMRLFKEYLEEALRDFMDENIRVRFIGDVSAFPAELRQLIQEVEEASAPKTGMVLNLAMNYGGRAEITRAAKRFAQEVQQGRRSPEELTEELFSQYLYTGGQPDPDLIIRPSGEERLSNFLLWQSAYAELVYFDILWPDFKTSDLDEALAIYASRQRRFGGV